MPGQFTASAVNSNNSMSVVAAHGCSEGNLVRNGGFELGLEYWETRNVGIVGGKEVHEGFRAAGMGRRGWNHLSASLQQTIELPTEKHLFYQLIFHVSGFKVRPASLRVCMTWMNSHGTPIEPNQQARIPRYAIGNGSRGQWNTYIIISGKAPHEASHIHLEFIKLPGYVRRNGLVIDDVILYPITGSFFSPCR